MLFSFCPSPPFAQFVGFGLFLKSNVRMFPEHSVRTHWQPHHVRDEKNKTIHQMITHISLFMRVRSDNNSTIKIIIIMLYYEILQLLLTIPPNQLF